MRAWSKAPGDTGRACSLPLSRVCGVLRAALACRERGPWPAYGPRTSRRRRPWGLDARARRGGKVCRGGSQPTRAVFRRRSVCVLRATSSARGCNSEPGPPPGIKLRGHELDCSLGALTLTLINPNPNPVAGARADLPPSPRLRTPGDAIGSGLRLRARATTLDQATRS